MHCFGAVVRFPAMSLRSRVPIVPLAIATTLVVGVVYLFNSMSSGKKVLSEPKVQKLVDLDGTETEVAIAPDGSRLIAIASGDLWLFNITDGSRKRLTQTVEPESFPAWAPDGKRVTFSRGLDTFVASADDFSTARIFKPGATALT